MRQLGIPEIRTEISAAQVVTMSAAQEMTVYVCPFFKTQPVLQFQAIC